MNTELTLRDHATLIFRVHCKHDSFRIILSSSETVKYTDKYNLLYYYYYYYFTKKKYNLLSAKKRKVIDVRYMPINIAPHKLKFASCATWHAT